MHYSSESLAGIIIIITIIIIIMLQNNLFHMERFFMYIFISPYLSVYLSIYLSIYDSTVLLLDLGRFFSFLILYTVGRTPWTGNQPVARPLPKHRITQAQNKRGYPRLEWDSNPRSQHWSKRRHFIP
jgi:hypothetical protein